MKNNQIFAKFNFSPYKLISMRLLKPLLLVTVTLLIWVVGVKVVFAQAIIFQNYFRWYVNNGAVDPTDPWPEGPNDLGELEPITLSDSPPAQGMVLRIRMSLYVDRASPGAIMPGDQFKLQFGEKTGASCSGISSWIDLAPPGNCTSAWCGYDNPGPNDGDPISPPGLLSVTDVTETYEEQNNAITFNPVNPDQDGEWDWVIYNHSATPNTSYCFRMVHADGTELDGYNYYPELITQAITVSGRVYADEGNIPIGANKTVVLKVNGADKCNGNNPCTAETDSNGNYTILNVDIDSANDVLTVFLDGELEKAVTVTKARDTTSHITDLDLYQNRVILRHEGSSAITNTDLGLYDKDNDLDIHFTSNNGSLTVDNDHELHLWTGKTFSPGGSVTISPGGPSPGGDLHLDDNATFIAGGAISVGGSWIADPGSTFIHNHNPVTFTAPDNRIILTNSQRFYDLIFDGSGYWSFQDNILIDNDLIVANGTISGNVDLTVNGGDIICGLNSCGEINLGGRVFLAGSGNFGSPNLASFWNFYDLTFEGVTTAQGDGTITIFHILTIDLGASLNAGSKTWNLNSSVSKPFEILGNFNSDFSTFIYSGDNIVGNTLITSTTYYHLTIDNSAETYLLSGNTFINGDLTINAGVLDVTRNNYDLFVKGSWINRNGTFYPQQGNVIFNGTSAGKIISSRLFPPPPQSPYGNCFYNLIFDGPSGEWKLLTESGHRADLCVVNNLKISAGTLSAELSDIYLLGDLQISDGIFNKGTGTFYFWGSGSSTWEDNSFTKQDLGKVEIAGSKMISLFSSVKCSQLIIDFSSTLKLLNYTLTLTGSGVGSNKPLIVNGTLDVSSSTIEYTGENETEITRLGYYNLTINGTGPFTAESGDLTILNNLNILSGTFNLGGNTTVGKDLTIGSNGTLDVTANNYSLTVFGSWTNSGGLFNAHSGTVTFSSNGTETITTNNQPFYNLIFDGFGSFNLQDVLDVNGDFYLNNGTLTQAPDFNINFAGNVTLNSTFNKATGSGKVIFDGNNASFKDFTTEKQNLGHVHIGTSPADLTLCSDTKMDSLTVNSGDTLYTNGYDLEIINDVNVNSNGKLDAETDRSGVCSASGDPTLIKLGTNWTVASDGIFLAGNSTVIFDKGTNSTLNSGGTDNHHAFNNLKIEKSSPATVTLINYDLNVKGNLEIANSNSTLDVSTNNYNLYVGGNWSNSGTFNARAGTVTFDANSTGKTIDSGGPGSGKTFYNIVFDSSNGGWTITNHLTANNNFSLLNAHDFTVNPTIGVVVHGTFTNLVGGERTTWNGSVLYLDSGTSYTINTKTAGGDNYGTLKISNSTHIKMWNSSAQDYVLLDPNSSLYSMDHNNVDGDLYIWGNYHLDGTDYWSYDTDFDGTPLGASSRQVKVYLKTVGNINPSVTVENAGTLIVKGGGSTVNDVTLVGQDTTEPWNFACYGTCYVSESTWNYLNLTGGTLTVINTILNNESVENGTLNVDWYLGVYVVDRATLQPIDTGENDIIISENSTNSQPTVWKWTNNGWGDPSTLQTTGTGSDGKIPQPGTDGAIRIREYSRTSTGYTFYKYNLYVNWQNASYGEYDYYLGYGHKYITSTLNIGSGEDECISENWLRYDIDNQNQPEQEIDEPPTNGTWYIGMISGLSVLLDSYSIDFGNISPGGNPVERTNTLTVSTSASNGYICYIFSTQEMKRVGGSETIPNWSGTNENPTEWPNGSYGFGYSTNDYDLTGGIPNRFFGPKFAGFTYDGLESKPIADRTGPSVNQQNTITYRLAVPSTQTAGTYTTTIIYLCLPNY